MSYHFLTIEINPNAKDIYSIFYAEIQLSGQTRLVILFNSNLNPSIHKKDYSKNL